MLLLRNASALALIALLATACGVPREAGFPEVAHTVEQRTGHRIFWNRGGEADAKVDKVVGDMLARELSVAEAVQIALLKNHDLQGEYEELSIAQADLVQAGLLHNPVFGGTVGFPLTSGESLTAGLGVELDFLGILLIPAKKRIASARFEAAKLRVGSAVIGLATEVRAAYFTLQGALQIVTMRQLVEEAAQASSELAQRQLEAGTMSELDALNQRSLYEDARSATLRSEADVAAAREPLTRLLGLPSSGFRVQPRLPMIPDTVPDADKLERLALERRLDLAAIKQQAEAYAQAANMTRDFRWLGGASVGAEVARESEGGWTAGPSVGLELPIFDQKQAQVARAEAELRRQHRRYQALEVKVRAEVRSSLARLGVARAMAERDRTVLIPLRERLVAEAQVHYNAMLLGVYPLLQAKQNEINAYRDYIENVRDYWIADAELGRAVGGRLPDSVLQKAAPGPAPPPSSPPPSPAQDHSH